jgi:hypothetical protein
LIVGAGANFEGGIDDRPIASAAAEISRQRIVDVVARGRTVAAVIMGKQAHDDTGRAKAALRTVLARHHFLHRM